MPLFLFFLLFASCLVSSPVGNGAFPKIVHQGFFIPSSSWVDLRVGYEGDFVGDARLEQKEEGSGRVDTFEQYTNSATTTFNLIDRLDLYALFGSSRVCADWRFQIEEEINRIEMETLYRFFWGIGARGIFYEWGPLSLGMGGRYSQCRYKPSWITLNGVPQEISGARLSWHEWQANIDLSYQIDLFTPYIGAQYASVRSELSKLSFPIANNGSGSDHFISRIPVGMVIGCTISNGRYFMLNIEGRLINEDALTLSGDIRF